MAKGAYIGVSGVAKKIKKGYIGVGGVAKKIKKAYIGVGGVARPCWSGGEPEYYGSAAALSKARHSLSGITFGNNALFAGGHFSGLSYDNVDRYNASLTKSSLTALGCKRGDMGKATVGNYVLFAGGWSGVDYSENDYGYVSKVDAYNTSFTRTSPNSIRHPIALMGGASIGNYALFAGGFVNDEDGGVCAYEVDTYNTSLTKGTATNLSDGRRILGAVTIGNYALFGPGAGNGGTNNGKILDAYDASLTRHAVTKLSSVQYDAVGTTVGNYALFGYSSGGNMIAFNTSLTLTTLKRYGTANLHVCATTLGNYALFGFGSLSTGGVSLNTVDVFDSNLTYLGTKEVGSDTRRNAAAATVGNYVLFAGGYNVDTSGHSSVEVCTI